MTIAGKLKTFEGQLDWLDNNVLDSWINYWLFGSYNVHKSPRSTDFLDTPTGDISTALYLAWLALNLLFPELDFAAIIPQFGKKALSSEIPTHGIELHSKQCLVLIPWCLVVLKVYHKIWPKVVEVKFMLDSQVAAVSPADKGNAFRVVTVPSSLNLTFIGKNPPPTLILFLFFFFSFFLRIWMSVTLSCANYWSTLLYWFLLAIF